MAGDMDMIRRAFSKSAKTSLGIATTSKTRAIALSFFIEFKPSTGITFSFGGRTKTPGEVGDRCF
jgi:hypothetical protein